MPISLVTLRATDREVLAGSGTTKTSQFGQIPDHWRGHDSELKLLEEISFRLRPYLTVPRGDFAPSAVKSPEVTGSVWVHSDFVICPSCAKRNLELHQPVPEREAGRHECSSRLTPAGSRRMMN